MSFFLSLEEDTFVHIFSFLTPENLLNVSHVSRELYEICSQDYFWKQYCQDYQEIPKNVKSYKDFFFQYIYLKRGFKEPIEGRKCISINIGVMGLPKSGKRSLCQKYVNPNFILDEKKTKANAFTLYSSNSNCSITIFADIFRPNMERVDGDFFFQRDALLICTDLSKSEEKWTIDEKKIIKYTLAETKAPNTKVFVVGTKSDLVTQESIEFPQEFSDFPKFICSVKDGTNVNKMFNSLINEIAHQKLKNKDYKLYEKWVTKRDLELERENKLKKRCLIQ